jgi:3-oxoacyl-[acyl-carrier-protein] synthase II
MNVVVTGIGLISALGSRDLTWKCLLAGQTAIKQRQPFQPLATRPLALIGDMPTCLEDLTRQLVLEALADAELSAPLSDCGVVIGSSRGKQAHWEALAAEFISKGAAPAEWLETLPNQAAITAAHFLGSTGPSLAPMAACATGVWAIVQGADLIRSGVCQRVLAGAVETPITPLTLAGFQQMGALAESGAYPFDQMREGMVLGEGGAILVLESEELASQRSARIYGHILGAGLTADGYHVSAPEPGSPAARRAIQQCLSRSGLIAEEISYIHAHGTATRLNDANEAALIQQLFPPQVRVSSTKGATGHTIGASAAIGTALCLMALQSQILPPCVGLESPEFDLSFVTQAEPGALKSALCFSFGFGGQNAVMAVGRSHK